MGNVSIPRSFSAVFFFSKSALATKCSCHGDGKAEDGDGKLTMVLNDSMLFRRERQEEQLEGLKG